MTSMQLDCRLLDALDRVQATPESQSLEKRLAVLCHDHAINATPAQLAQAVTEVEAQIRSPAVSERAPIFDAWARPTTHEQWEDIQNDVSWVNRLWSRTHRNMILGGVVAIAGVISTLVVRPLIFHKSLLPGENLFLEITLNFFLTLILGGFLCMIQSLTQALLSSSREAWRLKKWAKLLGVNLGSIKYYLEEATPDPEALRRWRKSPQCILLLKILLAQPVPLMTWDVRRLNEVMEAEVLDRQNARRRDAWQTGLHEVTLG